MNKIKKLKCEDCGANIEIKDGKTEGYCEYCGRKYIVNNQKSKEEYHLESLRVIEDYELKNLRLKEEEKTKREKFKIAESRKTMVTSIVGGIVFIIMCVIIGFSVNACEKRKLDKEEQAHIAKGEIKTTISASACEGKDYEDILIIFENAGFENIVFSEKADLIIGFLAKEYEVDSVTINGKSDFDKGDWFPKNALVRITYHVFP